MVERSWLGRVLECGAKKRDARGGGACRLPAGHGTDHPGYGLCRIHGGNTPSGKKAAAKAKQTAELERASAMLGLDRKVDALTALSEELWRTAGAVDWLRSRVREIDPDAIQTPAAQALIALYGSERDRLTKVAKTAIDVGLDMATVQLAQRQGELVARVIRLILKELRLTPEQYERAPAIARRHLLAVSEAE